MSRIVRGWARPNGHSEDLVGCLHPGERGRPGIPVGNDRVDHRDEFPDRAETAPSDGLAGQDAEPGLDLVIHDTEVGVKWKLIRGWRSSQARTAGVLWMDTLLGMTCNSTSG